MAFIELCPEAEHFSQRHSLARKRVDWLPPPLRSEMPFR